MWLNQKEMDSKTKGRKTPEGKWVEQSGSSSLALVCRELWDHSEEAVKDNTDSVGIRSHSKERRCKLSVTLVLRTVLQPIPRYD